MWRGECKHDDASLSTEDIQEQKDWTRLMRLPSRFSITKDVNVCIDFVPQNTLKYQCSHYYFRLPKQNTMISRGHCDTQNWIMNSKPCCAAKSLLLTVQRQRFVVSLFSLHVVSSSDSRWWLLYLVDTHLCARQLS